MRPTTRARRGWPTGTTRCCATPEPCSRARRAAERAAARWRPSARCWSSPTGSTPSRPGSRAWLDARGASERGRCARVVADARAVGRAGSAAGVLDRRDRVRPGPARPPGRGAGRSRRRAGAGAGDRSRSRRRRPGPGRRRHRHAVRPQPDRRLALAGGVRRGGRLRGRRRGAGPRRTGPGRDDGILVRASPGSADAPGRRRCGSTSGTTAGSPPSSRGAGPRDDDQRLAGLVLPGFANAHSHAFHRALRGRTHADGGTFWTWREGMYAVAAQLDPDSYLALARATYAEMALAGDHLRGRVPLPAPRAGRHAVRRPERDGQALQQAAADAGIRLTLLDACYLKGGLTPSGHTLLELPQRRFSDGTSSSGPPGCRGCSRPTRCGSAWPLHSVRAVPQIGSADRRRWRVRSGGRCTSTSPSSRPRTTPAWAYYGLLADRAAGRRGRARRPVHRGPRHAPQRARPSRCSAASRTNVCFCPDDRARPGRRHRPGAGAARRRRRADPRQRPARGDRPVRGGPRRWRCTSGWSRCERGRLRARRAGRGAMTVPATRLGWPDAGRLEVGARPTWSPCGWTPCAPPGRAPAQASDGGHGSRRARRRRRTAGRS